MSRRLLELVPAGASTSEFGVRYACQAIRRTDTAVDDVMEVFFDVSGEIPPLDPGDAEPFAITFVLLAMKEGRDLVVNGRISRTLLENLEEFVAYWAMVHPARFQSIRIHAPQVTDDATATRRAGAVAAFSGGVDATYTVANHSGTASVGDRGRLTHAVLVHGFDMPLVDRAGFERAAESARAVMDSRGIQLLTVRTNLSSVVAVPWEQLHAPATIAALYFARSVAGTAYLGSSDSYRDFYKTWGSNPVSDPVLSSDTFAVRHDGARSDRCGKIQLIAAQPLRATWR